MNQIAFSVVDAQRAIQERPEASFVDVVIPALSDDPETIEELQHAMRRFMAPDEQRPPLDGWLPGTCDEPFGAGICIIDLAARMIVYQSSFCEFLRRGQVTFDQVDEDRPRSVRWIPYHISDEWLVTDQRDGWQVVARARRQQRQANRPFDSREVLYEKVLEFIVDQCLAARGGSADDDFAWTPPADWQWRELPERAAEGKTTYVADAVAEIHARWLMTPRDDLRGRTPRDVLHDRRHDLSLHLQDRQYQWSTFGEPPQPLWRESIAFRCGGYGTHEIVVYYELVRHLIHECWDLLVTPPSGQIAFTRAQAIQRLGAIKQDWLHTPNDSDYSGKTPALVIESERLRIPMGVSGREAMIDADCPLCQMMADGGLYFWHLDGCNMDDEFPFALFETTREEWEEKQREWAEWGAELKRELAREAVGENEGDDFDGPEEHDDGEWSSPWQRSFSNPQPGEAPSLTLFGLGAHLGELIVDLRQPDSSPAEESQAWIDILNRDFGNLREAASGPGHALVEPVATQFKEHLQSLAEAQVDLAPKCLDLQRQLDAFTQRLHHLPEADDDVPF